MTIPGSTHSPAQSRRSPSPVGNVIGVWVLPRGVPQPIQDRGLNAYERLKAEWITAHPDATPSEYSASMTALARKAGV